MSKDITVSAAIVTYNDSDCIVKACKSLLENTKKYPLSLYVIDNASTDSTVSLCEQIDGVKVIKNSENLGFGAAHNIILSQGIGKYHFVINPDIEVKNDVISDMVDFFEQNSDVCMAMPKILNLDGSEQKLPKERPSFKRLYFGRFSHKIRNKYIWADKVLDAPTEIDFCTGCFFGIRGDIFTRLCGFDQRFFMYLEDADLTLRAKRKGKVLMCPQFAVTHAWHRDSAKSIKYLFIHVISSFKFLLKWRGKKI